MKYTLLLEGKVIRLWHIRRAKPKYTENFQSDLQLHSRSVIVFE